MVAVIVPLSGGWDSTYCLVAALARHGHGSVRALFCAYGQPNEAAEQRASVVIAGRLGVTWTGASMPFMSCKDGVYDNRNERILAVAKGEGAGEVWLGIRAPFACVDPYGDSNAEWARRMARRYAVAIVTPCILRPKLLIKRRVCAAGIARAAIVTTDSARIW